MITLLATLFALWMASPAAASAHTTRLQATGEVQRWSSPQTFRSSLARVDISSRGAALQRVPLTRCRSFYYSDAVGARVSTCGKKWRVRVKYVSYDRAPQPLLVHYRPVRAR